MSKLKIGYVQIYTGKGKGKTTAAMGLALRAAGSGLKVYIQQFAKNSESGEIKALRKFSNIKVSRCGNGPFIRCKPDISDVQCAVAGWRDAQINILSGRYDLVILDEINVAMKLGLVKERIVRETISKKPKHVEVVLTGRDCPASVRKIADLVTVMSEVKHFYKKGVVARRGIEY